MPKRTLDLQFPLGGVDKRLAVQRQKPFTTPYAVNVRPEGTLEKRLRGGSRPGIVKSFSARDSDNKVRLLTVMRSLNAEGRLSFAEDFSSQFDYSKWENMGQSGMDFPINVVNEQVKVVEREFMGGVLRNTSGKPGEKLNRSAPYSIEMWFDMSALFQVGEANTLAAFAELYAELPDSSPTLELGVFVQLGQFINLAGLGTFGATLSLRRNRETFLRSVSMNPSGGDSEPLGPGVLRLTVDGKSLSASWKPDPGAFGPAKTIDWVRATTESGSRVGFGVDIDLGVGGHVLADDFVLRYITTDAGIPPDAVVQSTNGNLLRESTEGALVAVTQAGITLASDRSLLAVDRLGKLYIADHGNRFSSDDTEEARQTDGIITNASPTVMTSAAITDWTDMGIEEDGDWLEILAVETGSAANIAAAIGIHRVDAQITEGNLILASALSIDDDISGITFRVCRGPKVYDAATNTMTIWVATAGSIPLGNSIVEVWSNRAVFGGDPEQPGIHQMSRADDFDDYDYGASATDSNRAFGDLSTTASGNQLSIPHSAIVALTEDYLVLSAESEFYILRGDPGLGGQQGNISRQIGIGSRTAWCRVPDGSLVFLTRDGIYKFHPSQPQLQSLSREKLPTELSEAVQNTDTVVTLEYDVRGRGVHIFIAPETAGATQHYWFDWVVQGFWPVALGGTEHDPFALTYDAKTNHVLMGCRDGYIRRHDLGATNDDGVAVAKEVDYGPIPLNRGLAAMADSLKFTLDDASDDVPWTFRSGHSPEEAFVAPVRASGTAKAGVNYVQSVRHFGQWGFLRLSTTGSVKWAVEAIELYVLTTPARARKI